jgi:endonuclease/exonuclease/phosphatase family metal-dependent hydrolase
MSGHRRLIVAMAIGMGCSLAQRAEMLRAATTGTFLDRAAPGDLRVVSYNVYFNSIFPATSTLGARFARVVHALDADIYALQETTVAPSYLAAHFNAIAPLPGGATWHAFTSGDSTIASKYPLLPTPTVGAPSMTALVDLPDHLYDVDLYVMNNHFQCCNVTDPPAPLDARERSRQRSADAVVKWIHDARAPGGTITLAPNTPLLVVGDLNTINPPNVLHPLETILTGDIYEEAVYDSDASPDWDGTSLVDARPIHNGRGPEQYTWRDDNQVFKPGVLDHIIYTDSVLTAANQFVLNTVAMTADERMATGLEEFDITLDLVGRNYDHLPVVVDFRVRTVPEPAAWMLAIVVMITFKPIAMVAARNVGAG